MINNEPLYSVVTTHINTLAAKYPFARADFIGYSVEGRRLSTLTVGSGSEYVLYVGGVHGMEYITTYLLLKFADELCRAIAEAGSLSGIRVNPVMAGRGLIIIPLLNPDGVEIAQTGGLINGQRSPFLDRISGGDFSQWNANANGVDLNHNFDAGWEELKKLEAAAGITSPAPRRFGGYSPESEPEVKALTQLCRNVYIRHATAYHSQGEEIYWQYGNFTPDYSYVMAPIMANFSGYTLAAPSEIASHGGFKDWFIEAFGRPGFTVECGRGKNPLPLSDFPAIYQRLEGMMTICLGL